MNSYVLANYDEAELAWFDKFQECKRIQFIDHSLDTGFKIGFCGLLYVKTDDSQHRYFEFYGSLGKFLMKLATGFIYIKEVHHACEPSD